MFSGSCLSTYHCFQSSFLVVTSPAFHHGEKNSLKVNEFLTAFSCQRCSHISRDDSSRHTIVCLMALFRFCSRTAALCLHFDIVEGAVLKMCEKEALAAISSAAPKKKKQRVFGLKHIRFLLHIHLAFSSLHGVQLWPTC